MRYALLMIVCIVSTSTLVAQETSPRDRVVATAGHYVEANTLAVGYADLDAAWIEGVQKEIAQALGQQGQAAASHPGFGVARSLITGMRAAGAREVMFVFGVGDLHKEGGPLLVITTTGGDTEKSIQLLASSLKEMMTGRQAAGFAVRGDGKGNVLVGSTATVDRYGGVKPAARPDLMMPLAACLSAKSQVATASRLGSVTSAALVIAPDEDSRRVIRDLWPPLPVPFDKLTGPLLADDAKHLILRATRPPEWSIEIELVARTDEVAEKLSEITSAGYELAVAHISTAHPDLADVSRQAARLLAVRQQGTSLTVRLDHANKEATQLVEQVVVPAVKTARERAQRMQGMNQMKQIALGMLNYESANGHIPAAAAIVDAEGKPLLSWRVAILPYLEQSALYNQFHLDEPWDSPHNLKLSHVVPSVFIDPSNPRLATHGKTVFQLPRHAESVFPPAQGPMDPEKKSYGGREWFVAPGTQYREITDGTSNTVMIVAVPAELAVVWTQPADWEVDLARAWQQLKGQGGGTTVTAFCDGSARAWDHEEDRFEELLPKFITRAGREIIEW